MKIQRTSHVPCYGRWRHASAVLSGGFGVLGTSASDSGRGVFGLSSGSAGVGVIGETTAGGIGVFGKALPGSTGYGVWGEAFSGGVDGVHGVAHTKFSGVAGLNDGSGFGVFGEAFGSAIDGVHGVTNNASGSGVAGVNLAAGDGVFGGSTGEFAGFFGGDVNVTENLSKGAVPSRSTTRSTQPTNTSITLSSNLRT